MISVTALAILAGLLWAGAVPPTAPWTTLIFGLTLWAWADLLVSIRD